MQKKSLFRDRGEAGVRLAKQLERFENRKGAVILGLARGGVPVAAEIALRLGLPLSVLVVRKIGAPDNPELALGAVAEGGEVVLAKDADNYAPEEYITAKVVEEMQEVKRRLRIFRGGRELDLKGKIAILVDDGVATGYTMLAAIRHAKALSAAEVVAAAPIIAESLVDTISSEADELFYVEAVHSLWAIGSAYADFPQVTDEEVLEILRVKASA